MRVLIAPDSFGGTLTAAEVAHAFRTGWQEIRASDHVDAIPLSDGGEGFLEVVGASVTAARTTTLEVAGTDSRPLLAPVLWLDDRTALLESATICGLPPAGTPRRPLEATSYGIGQALAAVLAQGAEHVVLGLGGTGVVDGGSGALNGLGMRLTVADGSGLRIGAGDLASCVAVSGGRSPWSDRVKLDLLADTDVVLAEAVTRYGPQKGVTEAQMDPLGAAMARWERILTEAYPGAVDGSTPRSGAAGGLGFALAVALGGRLLSGSAWIAERVGLAEAVAAADLVVTGEGRLDGTSSADKVVARVLATTAAHGRPAAVVVGALAPGAAEALGIPADRVVTAPAAGPGPKAVAAVTQAARTLAQRLSSVHS